MGWLKRLFGKDDKKSEPQATGPQSTPAIKTSRTAASSTATAERIPPERVGLNGEYDQSGLAKRVAQAFDNESGLDDIETLFVAQTGSTVVLKGKVPSQDLLDRMVSAAQKVNGSTSVDTTQVTVG
ncbi:MAG: BON domain-containing protein [Geitlerinemataceae cyanobacterium]